MEISLNKISVSFITINLLCLVTSFLLLSDPNSILKRMYKKDSRSIILPSEKRSYINVEDVLQSNIFNVMLNRRSQRRFESKKVESWKVELIFAAADTAPTAGGFQGFEIFHILNNEIKKQLVKAANNQPYVDAPLVLVFCKNHGRVKLNFPEKVKRKFSLQDATLAASYAQLAAHALGLSSIWIGMIDEKMIMSILNTDLIPSSILCIGYPKKILQPKPKRSLKDLIHKI